MQSKFETTFGEKGGGLLHNLPPWKFHNWFVRNFKDLGEV